MGLLPPSAGPKLNIGRYVLYDREALRRCHNPADGALIAMGEPRCVVKRRPFAAAPVLLATALLGVLCLVAPGASAQVAPSVWVDPTGQTIDYEDGSFIIDILLSDLEHHGVVSYDTNRDGEPDREESSNGLGAYELELHFNPDVVTVTGMEAGEFLRSEGRSTTCLQNGSLPGEFALGCVSVGGAEGPQGDGLLARITIEPVANGTTYLALEAGLAGPLGDTIDVTADSGIVEVVNGPTKPQPTAGSGGSQPTLDPGPDGTPGTDDDPPPQPFATPRPGDDTNNNGTPDVQETELVSRPDGTVQPGGNNDASDADDDGGSGTTTWIIVAVVGVVGLGVLAAASRLIIRARGI